MTILFITRKHPPSVGGMQQLSYHLIKAISSQVPVHVIKWGGSQRWLPLFLPYALVRALWVLRTTPITLIHLSDLVLSPLGVFLRSVSRRPVVANAHGLDVIYPNWLYQAVMPVCARQLDFVICNSEHTRQQCLAQSIKAERTEVIPPGVDITSFKLSLPEDKQIYWTRRWGLIPLPRHVLLTVGRLVPRKGVFFFVSEVLPCLIRRRNDWAYLIVGDGPERPFIEKAVQDRGLGEVVRVLGCVPEDELQAAYAIADLFVMPNISVPGDSEGFGIVALEARAAGLPVVATTVEGISDAFVAEDDGVLIPPGDADIFVETIDRLLETRLTIETRLRRRYQVESCYGWTHIAQRYLTVFRDVQTAYHARQNQGSYR